MNASHNNWGDLPCEITGLRNLQEIDLSHCEIKIISNKVFKSTSNLRRLILTGNKVGINHEQLENVFEFVPTLYSLVLSENRIKQLPRRIFVHLRNLTEIDLSHNSLTDLDVDLRYNLKLEKLDLRNNFLPFLGTEFTTMLKERQQSRQLLIDLHGNAFQCNCDAREFLDFVRHKMLRNIPVRKKKPIPLTEIDTEDLQKKCQLINYHAIIITTSIIVIITVIMSAIQVYRCRWKIAWKVYETRRFLRQSRQRKSLAIPVHK